MLLCSCRIHKAKSITVLYTKALPGFLIEGGGQIACNDVTRNFRKEGLFMGER